MDKKLLSNIVRRCKEMAVFTPLTHRKTKTVSEEEEKHIRYVLKIEPQVKVVTWIKIALDYLYQNLDSIHVSKFELDVRQDYDRKQPMTFVSVN